MAAPNSITVEQLQRRIGLPDAPMLIDVRIDADFAADPRTLPCAMRRDWRKVGEWAADVAGRRAVIICQRGAKLSHGVAAWLREAGVAAENLEGGFLAWAAAGAPLLSPDAVPPRGKDGRTLWVTRARPKVDRIACPWLIRRFVDPAARFLFVAPGEVADVADRFGATPFDSEGAIFAHRGDLCSFDAMLDDFDLRTKALDRLALVVRGADTGRLDLAPEAAGLLAASLGLSRLHRNDMAQLEAGMGLYDAFYRWARDATGETHDTTADA
ncbi:MAG: sulfurtransferase [Rhodospirillales bacterium]|jgi:rhodanese-related sulfurtransferase|nr:sulfurtransferase [Rhodospirillales bacterium]MDB5384095.1 sulfurtransferase [Rhodospirillales bacterium]